MDYWKAGQQVYDMKSEIISRFHPHLALIDNNIGIMFREKASVSAGRVIQGRTKKANKQLEVFHADDMVFIIELAADEWGKMSNEEQIALLDHHLCSMQAEEKDDGSINYKIAPPDFVGYKAEIERHGVWRYANQEDEDGAESVIMNLFGNNP